jgi:hypothetical protein
MKIKHMRIQWEIIRLVDNDNAVVFGPVKIGTPA